MESMMKTAFREFSAAFLEAAKETPRQYFAIFVGAYRGIRNEFAQIEAQRISN